MSKKRGFGGPILTLIVLGGIGYGGWYYWNKNSVKDPEYSTTTVARRTIIQSITATGALATVKQVAVGTQVSGEVKTVLVDFNDKVTKGQLIATIDDSTFQQKLNQAQASYEATKVSSANSISSANRTIELYKQGFATQSDNDSALSQIASAKSSLLSSEANLANAKLDVEHTNIYATMDGIILSRNADPGQTVNASTSAPTLFTIINDTTQLQISADVSESDIGNAREGQVVNFTVDAFPNRQFKGSVRQVRNASKTTNSVVTYTCLIDVPNLDNTLRPGMTASVAIVITERPMVPAVIGSVLRVRPPQDLMDEATKALGAPAASTAAAPMTAEEKMAAQQSVLVDAGLANGGVPTPDAIQKAKDLAAAKGLTDMSFITDIQANTGPARGKGGAGARSGGGARGGGGRGGQGSGQTTGAGINVSNAARTVYKLVSDAKGKKWPQEVKNVHLGVSDGQYYEIIDGLNEGDVLITYISMPGAAKAATAAPASNNPFAQTQGGRGGGGAGGFGGGGGGRGGG